MRGFFHYEGGTQGLCYQGVHHEVHGSSLGLEGRMQWGFSGWPGVRVGEFLWFQRILVGMMLTRVGDVQLIGWICLVGDVQQICWGPPGRGFAVGTGSAWDET